MDDEGRAREVTGFARAQERVGMRVREHEHLGAEPFLALALEVSCLEAREQLRGGRRWGLLARTTATDAPRRW
jgi:hypothetical protein